MEQEWEYIKRHRNAIVTFIVGCIIYGIIYGGFINRTTLLQMDEALVENHDTIFLATGRWVGYLFRAFLGHGPCYPIAGIMSCLLLNAAILFQQRLLGMQRLWQMLAFTTLYLCMLSWVENLTFATMSDFFAASVLLISVAAYFTPKQGYKNYGIAVLTLASALCCYQSSALCYMALVLLLAIREIGNKSAYESWRVLLKSFAVFIVAFLFYYASSKYAYTFALPEDQEIAVTYQTSLIGWCKLGQMDQSHAINYLIKYIVIVPFKGMVGSLPQLGQRLYGIVWIPALLLIWQTYRKHGIGKSGLMALFCIGLIYIPFLFSAVILNDRGSNPCVCMAQPIVLCGVWALGVFVHTDFCYRHRYILGTILFGMFVKYAYVANVSARDKVYDYELARQEMHDMYLLAKVEEEKAALPHGSYLVCGTQLPIAGKRRGIGGDHYANSALPTIMHARCDIDAFAAFFRLPKLRSATDEELAAHAQALSQMPQWPAAGSVKADGGAVLIKISDSEQQKNP